MKKPIIRRILSGVSAFAMTASFMFPSGFTLGTMAANQYSVDLAVKDHNKQDDVNLQPEGGCCYILVTLKDGNGDPVAWSLKNAWNAGTYGFDKFYVYEDDGTSTASELQFSDLSASASNYAEASASLFFAPDSNLKLYSNFINAEGKPQDNIARDVPGFSFMPAPDTINTTAFGTDNAKLSIFKNVSTYDIELTVEDGLATDGLYLVTQIEHTQSGTTYNVQKVEGTKTYSLQTEADGNTGKWYTSDGSETTENISGNEKSFTPYLVKAKAGMTEADIVKAAVKDKSQGTAVGYKAVVVTSTPTTKPTENGVTTVVSHFAITSQDIPKDVNFKNVLGNAVNFGVVADRFHKQDHAETNMAVNYYNDRSGTDISPDLSGDANFAGDFYVSHFIDFNFTGTVTDPATQPISDGKKPYVITEIKDDKGNVTGYNVTPEKGKEGYVYIARATSNVTVHTDSKGRIHSDSNKEIIKYEYISPDDCKNNVVDPMIAYFSEKSNTLKEQPANAVPVNMGSTGYFLNVQDYPADAVIYVDADKIADVLGGAADLHVNMKKGQTIVWNFDETKEVTINQFYVNFYNEDGTLDENNPVDTSAKTGGAGRDACEWVTRSFIWNLNSVERATLKKTAGAFINPNPNSIIESAETSSGWIATAGYYSNTGGEWHYMYSEAEELKSSLTYTIEVNKYDDSRNDLAGAQLGLYPVDADGNVAEAPKATLPQGTTGNNPDNMRVTPGRYAIKEFEAPSGYLMTDTIYYIEVTEDENAGTVTIKAFDNAKFTGEPLSTATYSPNSIGSNIYKDGNGNEYTFNNVTNLPDAKPNIFKNGVQITDEEELKKFTFTEVPGSKSKVVTFKGKELPVAEGLNTYEIEGVPFELKFGPAGVDKATAQKDLSAFNLSSNFFNATITFQGESQNFNLVFAPGAQNADVEFTSLGKVKVNYSNNFGTLVLNYVEITGGPAAENPFEVKEISDYTVSYDGKTLNPQINLSSKLDTQFDFTDGKGITINKVKIDGSTLTGATVALVRERYPVTNGQLTLDPAYPIPDETTDISRRNTVDWYPDRGIGYVNTSNIYYNDHPERTMTVYRLIETTVPEDYKTPTEDLIIFKHYVARGVYNWYTITVPHGEPLTEPFLITDDTGNSVINDGEGKWTLVDVENSEEARTFNIVNEHKDTIINLSKQELTKADDGTVVGKQIPALDDNGTVTENTATFTLTPATDGDTLIGKTIGGYTITDNSTIDDGYDATTGSYTFKGGSNTTMVGLAPGKTYTLQEVVPPKGYDLPVKSEFTFTVNAVGTVDPDSITATTNGEFQVYPDGTTLIVLDSPAKFKFNKYDFTGENELDGAELKLYGENEVLISSWTSKAGETWEVPVLEDGNYVLKETTSPDGYQKITTEISFHVSAGKIYDLMGAEESSTGVIMIKDAPSKITVDKKALVIDDEGTKTVTAIPTNADGSENSATFTLTAPEGVSLLGVKVGDTVIAEGVEGYDAKTNSYTFTGNSTEFTGLKNSGKDANKYYTLSEVNAPNGYTAITDMTFTITDGVIDTKSVETNGDCELTYDEKNQKQILTILDKATDTKVFEINKVDITGKKELEGATLELLDSKGTVIDTWTSEIGKTWTVENLPEGTYTLRETVAPDGYTLATDTTFVIDKDGNIDKDKTTAKVSEAGVILVEDDLSDITISKKVITDGKAETPKDEKVTFKLTTTDADLTGVEVDGKAVESKDGKPVKSTTFTGNETEFKGLKDGTYTLEETVAPDGYKTVSTFTFKIENGEIVKDSLSAVTTGEVELDENGNLIVKDAPKDSIQITKQIITTDDKGNT
ncbi:MAG: hypothetical protein J5851_07150, partial [Oscillospiraceae bacterium]|nr:hypothetical protein [Oscillospiraceae bacterium]